MLKAEKKFFIIDPPNAKFDFEHERSRCTAYPNVPKDPRENAIFRKAILRWAARTKTHARALWHVCRQDVLFYINTFCFTYNPKLAGAKAIPFITYEFQDQTILAMVWAIRNGKDIAMDKSREMGASWMALVAYEWFWHFHDLQSFLLVSRKEDYVDCTGDLDSLMQKLDFVHKLQPKWLVPKIERSILHMRNLDNGSTIDGESTNADVGRGGRRTSILLDEFASVVNGQEILSATRDTSACRIFNSTPKGAGNAFYDVIHRGQGMHIRLHWIAHPVKAAGLYYDAEGKARSPWYDEQCARAIHPAEIGQELDIDYLASDYTFFPVELLDKIRVEDVRPPTATGHLDFDADSLHPQQFAPQEGGPFRLWMHLEGDSKPRRGEYCFGIDIATGSRNVSGQGASNSVIAVYDRATGEKVAEYAQAGLDPFKFAHVAIALAKWFADLSGSPAFMVWEANGPGQQFGNEIWDRGFRHFYYRRAEGNVVRRTSEQPGFWSTGPTKRLLLGRYKQGLIERKVINHSYEAIDEARYYVYGASGEIHHSRANRSADPTGARDNHGDRVIADALGYWGCIERPSEVKKDDEGPKPGSLAHRMAERKGELDADGHDLEWMIDRVEREDELDQAFATLLHDRTN